VLLRPRPVAAVIYSTVVFTGNVFTWLMNGLASVVRGTGNMHYPAIVTLVGVLFLIPISPVLIFGLGPIPGFGIAGGGIALVAYYAAGTIAMLWYILAGRTPVRLHLAQVQSSLLSGLLRVGALSAMNSILTNIVIAGTTALSAASAGCSPEPRRRSRRGHGPGSGTATR
jgi:Na+-driven multidrug efflux pump